MNRKLFRFFSLFFFFFFWRITLARKSRRILLYLLCLVIFFLTPRVLQFGVNRLQTNCSIMDTIEGNWKLYAVTRYHAFIYNCSPTHTHTQSAHGFVTWWFFSYALSAPPLPPSLSLAVSVVSVGLSTVSSMARHWFLMTVDRRIPGATFIRELYQQCQVYRRNSRLVQTVVADLLSPAIWIFGIWTFRHLNDH